MDRLNRNRARKSLPPGDVAATELQFYVRVTAVKVVDIGQHDIGCMSAVQIDAQQAAGVGAGLAQCGFGFLEFRQYAQAALIKLLAIGRGFYLSGGPFQQPGSKSGFQIFDRLGGGGARYTQRFGGLGKTAQFDDATEQLKGVESIHCLSFLNS